MSQRIVNIIRHYQRWKAMNPDRCIEFCANQDTLSNAILCAARSVDGNGKKHPHQYRLQQMTLQDFGESIIEHLNSIAAAQNFEQLIEVVRTARVYGIGELAIYDVAVRIGAFRDIWPDKVYLHAGAKIGASALIDGPIDDVILKEDLPLAFRNSDLSCYELEDIMCIYKKLFLYVKHKTV